MEERIRQILEVCGYPTNIVVLDWESFYSSIYRMGSGGLSTVEYVFNEQFAPLGLGYCENFGGIKYITPTGVSKLYDVMKNWCDNYTMVAHNFSFDGLVIKKMYGLYPKYAVDTIGLSRYFEARAKHSLKECAIRYGLQPKGELAFAKGKHWKDLTPPLRKQLISYAKNDVEITNKLFEIMLPILPRPEKELAIMQDLLERGWEPWLEFDFEKAEELKNSMEEQINKKLLEIDWL